mgnify:CR=1 FL=1
MKEESYEEYSERMYLIYVNDFLTASVFAETYRLSTDEANELIDRGRIINQIKMRDSNVEKRGY